MPKLAELIEDKKASWTRLSTPYWYGDERCVLEIVTGTAVWYHSGLRSADPLGAHARSHGRARYAEISVHESRCDADRNSRMVREPFVHRNNIPGMPRASRRRNQRQWSDLAIARTTPALFGKLSLIALRWRTPKSPSAFTRDPPPAYHKREPSFCDAVAAFRRVFWSAPVFQCRGFLGRCGNSHRPHGKTHQRTMLHGVKSPKST